MAGTQNCKNSDMCLELTTVRTLTWGWNSQLKELAHVAGTDNCENTHIVAGLHNCENSHMWLELTTVRTLTYGWYS